MLTIEFSVYVWRIRHLPSNLGVGVVCEHVYTPASKHADLRLMSFDVKTLDGAYDITMVFSDSSLKVASSVSFTRIYTDSVKLYRYTPARAVAWQAIARGNYSTCCLTQCVFLSSTRVLTISTDGNSVIWPLTSAANNECVETLCWEHPARIHQNSSKAMATYQIVEDAMLIVSGGDDGSLSLLLASTATTSSTLQAAMVYACPPMLVSRAHGSAVTACAVVADGPRTLILTCGNDEWVRLWEVKLSATGQEPNVGMGSGNKREMEVVRLQKVKTSVADVSSMAVLATEEGCARVLLCGVGMEVIRLDWEL